MIKKEDLRKIAKARLEDSEVLYNNQRYDGSVYVCGYAIEIALKARICQTLRWEEFPYTSGEFRDLQSFKTHNLDALLRLSGIEKKITTAYFADWSTVASWDPEVRYKSIGAATQTDAKNMVESAKKLLKVIWKR